MRSLKALLAFAFLAPALAEAGSKPASLEDLVGYRLVVGTPPKGADYEKVGFVNLEPRTAGADKKVVSTGRIERSAGGEFTLSKGDELAIKKVEVGEWTKSGSRSVTVTLESKPGGESFVLNLVEGDRAHPLDAKALLEMLAKAELNSKGYDKRAEKKNLGTKPEGAEGTWKINLHMRISGDASKPALEDVEEEN
jgi:hypothetical protein